VKKGGKRRSQWYSIALPDKLTAGVGCDPAHGQMALIFDALTTGNVHPLIECIRRGPQLIGPLQDFFIALLLRKVKFPKWRPDSPDTWRRHFSIAWFVAMRERDRVNRSEAISEAEDKFGVDRRTVQRAIKEMHALLSNPKNMESYLALSALSGADPSKVRLILDTTSLELFLEGGSPRGVEADANRATVSTDLAR
jgi:hypothetical protein